MTRDILRNLALGSLGFLFTSGAWAQSDSGSATAAASTATTSAEAAADLVLTGILDSAAQSTGSAPSNSSSPRSRQKRSDVFDDAVIGGVTRNDDGFRFPPSLNANDFAAQAGPTVKALGVNATGGGSSAQPAAYDRALGAIANVSNTNPAAVSSVHAGENGKALGLNSTPGDAGNHKGLGHRDDAFLAQTVAIGNTVISDAMPTQAAGATAVPSATPAAVRSAIATNVSDLSATTLGAAPAPVPEPANWLLLALGLLALGARRVMRRGLR